MKEIVEKNRCTGCSACASICPKGAIELVEDNEGFKHPIIDQDKCINCGLCKRNCPVLNTKENSSLNKCYVAYNKNDKVKKTSSSGGIFDAIAREVLNNNGIVVGAAFNENMKLNHIAIEKIEDLEKLKGSKYLQSDLDNIFTYIKSQINDRKILFVGTPCQVAGLHAYLKKDYDNLICIDLFCHGVPSPKLFNKYIKELESSNNSKVVKYNFRDKKTGWDTYSNTASFEDDKQISELQSNNLYMRLFLSDIALRESCYNCNFKVGNKYSDITLGDFWGVQKYYPEMYNKNGVSAIIINTEKGKRIFESISNNLKYKECELEEIVAGNPSLKSSGKYPKNRKKFFRDMDSLSIKKLKNKYANISLIKKIKGKIKGVIKKFIK